MSVFWDDILKVANGEVIEGVVIGEMGWPDYNEEGREVPAEKKGVILSKDEAKELLSYPYDSGYGAPSCHSVYVWTADHILFIVPYDGSTSINKIPRNPTAVMPEMPGG